MNAPSVPLEAIQAEILAASAAHQTAQIATQSLHARYHAAVEQELIALARLNRAHAALAEYYETAARIASAA